MIPSTFVPLPAVLTNLTGTAIWTAGGNRVRRGGGLVAGQDLRGGGREGGSGGTGDNDGQGENANGELHG